MPISRARTQSCSEMFITVSATMVIGTALTVPCIIWAYTSMPLAKSCLISALNLSHNVCSRGGDCQCVPCGWPSCDSVEATNTTGPCCGGRCSYRNANPRLCRAEIGRCYDFDLHFTLDQDRHHLVVKCKLNEDSCWDYYASRLTTYPEKNWTIRKMFSCWRTRGSTEPLWSDPGQNIVAWIYASVTFCLVLFSFWYLFRWCWYRYK